MSLHRPRALDDEGVSLIELIVYFLLASLVVLTTASILINSFTTQRNVSSVTQATSRGQGMGAIIERAVRNSVAYEIASDGTWLKVQTTLGGNLKCQGFSLTTGEARLSQSASMLASPSNWTTWTQGVQPQGTTRYFTESGERVVYTFDLSTSGGSVRITGDAEPRSVAIGSSGGCW
ncbi:hypothetical protein ACH3VR_19235 [Microbacterium sp. B2969]|uniref:Prepilin-type N-terminal cleavage/methylation domain-containing protein n=1 Tax=Microbacterium alkaliflavum TaxID=3248839 RepID=A0ABW7QCS1_9MICO